MPKYITTVDRWLSHECRTAKAGETFETTFPEHMKLGEALELVKDEGKKPGGKKPDDKASADLV